ncbi:glycosyltransferase family 2 protein [Candidatus Uhrbacteria bacterium]|nr:glycosyltransferase family 2 protein [Candidatus Uhrbacteria bacterium]
MAEASQNITTIIVSWNVRDTLIKNLEQLSGDIVVVDNASSDGSVEAVRAKFPHIRVIANQKNLGFAKACNQGIALAKGHVLLLNPDMLASEEAVAKTAAYLDAHPDVAVVGAKLLDQNGKAMHHMRRFPTWKDQLVILLKMNRVFPSIIDRYMGKDLDLEREQDVDTVRGSFFAINRTALDNIGALDERYFIWFEEVDYCRQAKAHGMRVRYVPDIVVKDLVGKSFAKRNRIWKRWQFTKSLLNYFWKWL